jgi:PhnB protein
MAAINPYLNFDGNCEDAFNFYKSIFGGEFQTVMRYKEMPGEYQMAPGEGQKIMHVALPIGQGTTLMGSDTPADMGPTTVGKNLSISINAGSEAEANKLFKGLSASGQVTMPLEKAFWGSLFGMLTDKYGVQWMVSYDYNQQR